MNHSNVILDVGAEGPAKTGITQHDITQLAKMIGDLQSFVSKVQAEDAHNKKLFTEINLAVDVSNDAFMQVCASLSISPKWVEQKYADQFAARSLFANVSTYTALASNGESGKAQTNLIQGLFGLAVSHGIFGQVAVSELQRNSWEHGLTDVYEAAVRVGQVRDSITQILLEEVLRVVATAGDLWNANIRNRLRDIVWVAMEAETAGVPNERAIARIKKAADALLYGVGITPLHAV